MPCLVDDEDVELLVDDGAAERRRLVADRASIDAAERQAVSAGYRSSAKRSLTGCRV